jgi:hypothetical protein
VLPIFIAFENPPLSAEFEPANLGFNNKHDNHYTTENGYSTIRRYKNFEGEKVLLYKLR